MSNIFFVFGPESAGNHITSRVLQTMGCYWEEPQRLDDYLQGKVSLEEVTTNKNIVLRRSVPHGHEWSNPLNIRQRFINHPFTTIIPVRDWMPNIFSNYYHREHTMDDALVKIQKAWSHIGKYLHLLESFYFFNTSILFKNPQAAIESLEYFTGLKWPENVNPRKFIYDADRGKHKLFSKHGFKTLDRAIIRQEIG